MPITFAIHTGSQNPFGEGRMAHLKVASFAFPSKIGSTSFLATKHPMDVSPLTDQVMLDLKPSTRIHPITVWPSLLPSSLPIPPTACLTVSLPKGEGMGLSRSTYPTTNTLGPLCLPVGLLPASDVHRPIRTTHLPFGPSLTAPLACSSSRQLRVFTYVNHSILS